MLLFLLITNRLMRLFLCFRTRIVAQNALMYVINYGEMRKKTHICDTFVILRCDTNF